MRESYIDACDKAGCFLPEEPFEWSLNEIDLAEEERLTVKAAQKWRKQLHGLEGKKGAFEGWNVLILMGSSRTAGFNRVLVAGGAQVTIHKGKWMDLKVI